jgi:hypothetical protein
MILKSTTILSLFWACILFASSPKTVTHNSKVDFERGKLDNVTILHDGKIMPSPVIKKLIDTGEPFIWSIAEDTNGALYIATGMDGQLYKVSAKGDAALFFDAPEMNIFAVAVDAKNNVYAATSPEGQVYKINQSGESSSFFDPDAVFIWDLLIDADGNVLVATGEKAAIHKVTPDGKSSVVFEGEENHVRTMIQVNGSIYAGTSSKGFVYRISPGEKPFVLFDTQMKEVFALAMAADGFIYAAVSGEAMMPILQPTVAAQTERQQPSINGEPANGDAQASVGTQTTTPKRLSIFSRSAPTSLFRISPEGYGKDLWIGVDDKIQSLLLDEKQGVIVGTGKNGKLLAINPRGDLSVLLNNDESHITSLYRTRKNKIVIGMSNLGRCYMINESAAKEAVFESETIDAGLPAQWGAFSWEGEKATFFTRSGNTEQPSNTWSSWEDVKKQAGIAQIKSPMARFIQWKCELSSADAVVDEVSLSYKQKNLAPGLSSIIIHKSGQYYEIKENSSSKNSGIAFPAPLPPKQDKKGYRTIDWLFDDPNFDALQFDLYYLRKGSSTWRALAEDLNTNMFSWDSEQMMDGEYQIKVVATDALDNSKSLALTGDKVSRTFIIDNTGPRIEGVKLGNKSGQKLLTFRIIDEWNSLKTVEFSIDAQEWETLDPADGILDSKIEDFVLEIPTTKNCDIAVKATDSIGNVRVVHKNLN